MYGALCEPWPVDWCCDLTGVSPAVTGDAVMIASEVLWAATGHRFGNCTVRLRPCRRDCSSEWPSDIIWSDGVLSSSMWSWPWPALHNGVWMNLGCGSCYGDCGCSSVAEIVLPETVASLSDVVVDGVSIIDDVALYDQVRVVRTDGGDFPTCQNWAVTGGPGSWYIDASFGAEVPALGRRAAADLACEISKMCSGLIDECRLPDRVTSVSRQGVSFSVTPDNLIADGQVGLYLPDLFIRTYNPNGLRDRARAYSPDVFNPRAQGIPG